MGIRVTSVANWATLIVCALSAGCSGQQQGPEAPTAGTAGLPAGEGGLSAGGNVSSGGSLSGGAAAGGSAGANVAGSSSAGANNTSGAANGGSNAAGGATSPGGSTNVAGAGPVQASGPCGLENPAFCEDFEGADKPGGRGGPLDENVWSVSRYGIASTIAIFTRLAATSTESGVENTPTLCGQQFSNLLPPNDIRLCASEGGSRRLEEVMNDAGAFGFTSMRIRQPFDFTGRVGTVAFEVDAKRNKDYDGHGWWTEIWISKEPVPMPYHGAPTVASYVTDAVGFQIAPAGGSCFGDVGCNQVGRVIVSKDYKLTRDTVISDSGGFKVADGKGNRFKLLISQDSAEFWASDFDNPNTLRRVAVVKELGLRFSVGYVHIQHAQYNASKANASSSQTFRWDNIGFDGPKQAKPRAYEIDDDGYSAKPQEHQVGYSLSNPVSVSVKDVDLSAAKRAIFGFNLHAAGNKAFRYRFNGKEWHTFMTPSEFDSQITLRSFSVEVPLSELVAGVNKLEMDQPQQDKPIEYVGNMDLTIDAQ
ncbi:MAG TPA: hypothetical protein VFQ61_32920 [Polyangiaceae bacterium]|nr:hypothetical protein [Polyangiaceae bacterium]